MKSLKPAFTFVFIFLYQAVFSQWQQLPDFKNGGSIEDVCPAANGKLFLCVYISPGPSPSTAPPAELFGHCTDAAYSFFWDFSLGSSSGIVREIETVNDSTGYYRSFSSLNITFKRFMPRRQILPGLYSAGKPFKIGTCGMSTKFVYYTKQVYSFGNPLMTNDTLVFTRENATAAEMVTKLPQYADGEMKLNFVNDSVGFLIVRHRNDTSKTGLIKTENYGQTWSEVFTDTGGNAIVDFSFPLVTVGYILRANGTVFKTINGGITWFPCSNPSGPARHIKFASGTLGYTYGPNGLLWRTIDGGVSWQSEISNTTKDIKKLYTFGNVGYFVDNNNNVFKNNALVVGVRDLNLDESQIRIFPVPAAGHLTIDLTASSELVKSIKIINLLGATVYEKNIPDNSNNTVQYLQFEGLSLGTYILKIETRNGVLQKKIIISN